MISDDSTETDAVLAFAFPGQGSQSLGMLAPLADGCPQVRETFAEASEVLGYDLWRLVQEGPEVELNRTERTQPVLLAAGVAVWRCWRARGGVLPARLAGHSLGEYTALVCAGALRYADAVALVAERGRRMQQAVPAGTGSMAAILGLEDAQVQALCAQAAQGEVVAPANFNAPGQVVVAGHGAAVERVAALARQAGAKRAVTLAVSVPSHCELMRPAAEGLAERLSGVDLRAPRIPVLHNADVAFHAEPDEIRAALLRQLYSPVRWTATVQRMAEHGTRVLLECGPGKVLTGLNKRIVRNLQALPLLDPQAMDAALAALQGEGK